MIKFFLNLKYLILTLILIIIFFFQLPKLFEFEDKIPLIKKDLQKSYDIQLESYEKLKYSILPSPNLSIINPKFYFVENNLKSTDGILIMSINLFDIYNFKKMQIKNIHIKENKFSIEINNLIEDINSLIKVKNKFFVSDSSLLIHDKNDQITKLTNFNYDNSNHDKINFSLNFFGNGFNFTLNKKKIVNNFLVSSKDLGLKCDINFKKKTNNFEGDGKIELLNSILKFKFTQDNERLNLEKTIFRNNNILLNLNSAIILKPFFLIDAIINLEKFNVDKKSFISFLNNIDKFKYKRKINGKFQFISKNRLFNNELLKELFLNLEFENGNIKINKSFIKFEGGSVFFSGELKDFGDYKRLNLNKQLIINDMELFKKKYRITNLVNENKNIEIYSSINLTTGKINLNEIIYQKRKLSKTDLKSLKVKIEKFLIYEGILNSLDYDKIRIFIEEII